MHGDADGKGEIFSKRGSTQLGEVIQSVFIKAGCEGGKVRDLGRFSSGGKLLGGEWIE